MALALIIKQKKKNSLRKYYLSDSMYHTLSTVEIKYVS